MWLGIASVLLASLLSVGRTQLHLQDDFEEDTLLSRNWRDAAGHDLQGTSCGAIASGNSLVFDASPDRYLISQSFNTTNAVAMQFVFGHAGCGVESTTSFPVYFEYIRGDTSYLLDVLRTTSSFSSELYSIRLPSLARGESVQFSWTQATGFRSSESVWQLDNVALLFANEINSSLLDTFSRPLQSRSVLFYSGGSIEANVCSNDDEQLVFTGSDQLLPEYVLTPPFTFSSNSIPQACSAPCLCGPGGYSDNFDTASYNYALWERVVGGQVQGSLCDDVTPNPVLLFNTDGANELVTMPLNLTDIRMMSFDLEIFGTLLNGSCRPMREGNVVLSYRIGTSRQWKIIEEYSALDYFNGRGITSRIPDCMQTCGIQLRWQFSLIQSNGFWSIDNIEIGSNSNSVPINRRTVNELEAEHHLEKRQSVADCDLYYDNFDTGSYASALWSSVSGSSVAESPCGTLVESHYWLGFTGSSSRQAITQSLDLRGIEVVYFNLIFGSGTNGCSTPSSSEGISVQYRLSSTGSWQTMETYEPSCCTTSTERTIYFPLAVQLNDVYLRWYQPSFSRYTGSDYWAIDEVRLGEVTVNLLYQDTFSTINNNIWLSVIGGSVTTPSCGVTHEGTALYFTSDYTRQAVTQALDFRRAESISFYLRIGSDTGSCESAEIGEDIELSWRANNGAWSLLDTLSYSSFRDTRLVFIGLYDAVRVENVQIRISQAVLTTTLYDTWSIDNFEVHSYNSSSGAACSIPPDPTPTPATSTTPSACNHYSDNFDAGSYKSSLWSSTTGMRILSSPCGLPLTQHYAMQFYSTSTRYMITQILDLRGVEYIKFYLRSGSSSNGCSTPSSSEGIYVAYSFSSSSTWYNLEYYAPSCCSNGNTFTLYLPSAVQVNSVQLRWHQPSHTSYSGSDTWILDDVEIGEIVDTILYEDPFTSTLSSTLWSSVVGGSVSSSSCAAIDIGSSLYFSQNGTREAVTRFLDLRQAEAVSFYLMTTSSACDGLDSGETVELSIRAGYGSWTTLQSINGATSTYYYVQIPDNMKVHSVQLRWMQNVPVINGYDVWAIDSIEVHSVFERTICSTACVSDSFNADTYSSSVWSSVSGSQVTTSPCSTKASSRVLYFSGSSTRQAITQPLDLRGLYAVSFTLQIVAYSNQRCAEITSGNDVRVYYSTNGGSNWIEIGSFSGRKFAVETIATVALPLEARGESVSIRIAQPSFSSAVVWSIDDFGIYTPNQCPPLSVGQTSTIIPPTPTPTPSPSLGCNYYWDNFDSSSFMSSLWSSTLGMRILLQPCRVSSLQRHAAQFYSSSTRQLLTQPLDLRGVETISFYLLSGSSSSGCSTPSSTEGIYVAYRLSSSSTYNTLEYFAPSCCSSGKSIVINVPPVAQVSSVYLRWSQPSHTSYSGSDTWIIDDIVIGKYVDTTLYSDDFTSSYDESLWAVTSGGSIRTPPCGATYSGNALYFSQAGNREAITKPLDMRDARALSFYIRIGDSTGACEPADTGENIELLYRINYNRWTVLQTYIATSYRDALYIYTTIDQALQVNGVQFRIKQQVLATDSYDVWSIDNFAIVSRERETKCSTACYSDNFNSGSYSNTFWRIINGASVMIPPCSDMFYGRSLYFTDSGTREAITNNFDLRGIYAVTFTIQIGSYDNECDQAEAGDNVILYYSEGSNWVQLQTFIPSSYTRATTVTVPIPRTVRVQEVSLRWAQPQHSGASQDTWFIDNVGVYSPSQCPPTVYQSTTPSPAVPSPLLAQRLSCNFYSDNFDAGSYKTSLWSSALGMRILLSPCGLPSTQHYAMQFYSSSTRYMITQILDLRGVEYIKFYLRSGSSSNGCSTPSSNEGIYVAYSFTSSSTWYNLEYYAPSCCTNGNTFTLYLPSAVQVSSVQLRWYQPSHTSYSGSDTWILDDVEIGNVIDTTLYEDIFTNSINANVWSSITGGSVATPPCGSTDSGQALYFSGEGVREAVTASLDLRQATGVSFYLRIGSDDSTCETADTAENIELSHKVGSSGWVSLQTFTSTSYRTAGYIYIDIQNQLKFNGVQFRIRQAVLTANSYDVWSIDTFTIHSAAQRPACTVACHFDNFYNGYSTSVWSMITGGSVAPLTCDTNYEYSDGLYFNGSSTRSATTRSLDLNDLYAISFALQVISSNDDCSSVTNGQSISLMYSVNSGTWTEIETFSPANYGLLTNVTVELPVNARKSNIAIRLLQAYDSSTVWAIDNFGIYSPNTCPPTNYATVTTTMSPTPLPYPSPISSTVCNYYTDNFDTGSYKASVWGTVTGVRVTLQPCQLPYVQHYAMEFFSSSTRQLITDPLDLRGVEFISFYLLSGATSNGCSQPSSTEGMYVSYRIGSSSTYYDLEYFQPSCCYTGANLKIYLPSAAQTTSVYIRWYQRSHSSYTSSDLWLLDNVEIGYNVDNYFYEDYFTSSISSTVWLSVVGGSVTTPPCGATHLGTTLYFSAEGSREAVTQSLDLRHATGVSFYLRIGSSDGRCENSDSNEAVVLSWRVNFGAWTQIGTYGGYMDSRYVYVSLTDSIQVSGIQFQITQNIPAAANEDVWSIDDFIVHSMYPDTLCTLACYSDDFNNGQYSSSLWSNVDGASVTIPPCSNQYFGNALYFEGSGSREAITRPLDVRGLYAISFYLHIGSFSGSCEQAESGENVNLHYQLSDDSTWILLRSYDSTSFTRETKITEALPREAQQGAVTFRWMQASHSGALDDTWSLDNVGFHSPDECPPAGYGPVTATSVSTTTYTSFPSPTPTMLSACNYYSDNFDDGSYDSNIWETATGVRVTRSPCQLPSTQIFGMEFYSSGTRRLTTRSLDLRGVEIIRFYLLSGTSSNGCSTPSSSEGITVAYRISTSSTWNTIESLVPSCCTSGANLQVSLPAAAQLNGVYLRWSQPSHSSYTSSDLWVLDSVEIGENVDVVLYEDTFSTSLNSQLWSSVIGGTVANPPCGATYSGTALYFGESGTREVVTQFLDLRQAASVTFYLGIGSTDGDCEQSDSPEAVELSFRAGYNSWTRLQAFSPDTYIDTRYVSVGISESMRTHSGQFRLMQNVIATLNYDVWSIDNFEIHSIYDRTICSLPCISDSFDSGSYSTQVWSAVDGGRVTRPPCSSAASNGLLYFDQTGTRQAITQSLDLRGMYAISFTLQIVSYSGICSSVTSAEYVRVYYSSNSGSSWNELQEFDGRNFATETRVTVALPRLARSQSISIRIAQPSYSNSVWSIENFEIYSPDVCPPMGITNTATIIPPTPTPTTLSMCNYYSDNFDSGTYKSTLWSSVTGVRVQLQPCGLSYLRHFGMEFYSSSTRQLITTALDLRGVEYISFYLLSGTSTNGCSTPSSSEGIYVAYRISTSSSYVSLEYFEPSCCTSGVTLRVYLPTVAQASSVYLRWSQPSHSSYTNSDLWVLDNIQIGQTVDTTLYSDAFTSGYSSSVWSAVQGGSVSSPPCGATHSGGALYFSQSGLRKATTHSLDLRDATGLSFYLRIGSSDDRCEQGELGENIELSYRAGLSGRWTSLQIFSPSNYINAEYVYIALDSSFQYSDIQFQFTQSVMTTASYDVWSIDDFEITSSEQQTKCTMACYSDNFNSGVLDATLWSSTSGSSITVPPCSDVFAGRSLYFTGSGRREAITNNLDLRGLYAVTFTLQIGSYDSECDQAESGDDVVLYYSFSGSTWTSLQTFSATSYIRATSITVPLPRTIRVQGVSLRWAQAQHSGSLQDTWFIDDVGVYSPNQCPPIAYQMTSTTTTMQPTPTPTPPPATCNYFSDNFDTGTYDNTLWNSVIGVAARERPCGSPSSNHYGMLFTSSSTRQLRTESLDLRGVESISFYLRSGSSSNGCSIPSASEGISVSYSLSGSSAWNELEYYAPDCCQSGATLTIYLPAAVQVNSVSLRWSQPSHSSYTNSDAWVLDNVQIGERFEIQLYSDTFSDSLDASLWMSNTGGSVTLPSCGATDTGNAIYFSAGGYRELVSQSLDLSQASELSFYLRIGSSDNTCEGADPGEDVEVAYKVSSDTTWTSLATYDATSYRTAQYLLINLPTAARQANVQLRFMQVIRTSENEDVWSIDTFSIKGVLPGIQCAYTCFTETFDAGYFNPGLWSRVQGGQITISSCGSGSRAASFSGATTRELLSQQLDLTSIYAISFVLRIGSSTTDCSNYINGETIRFSYSLNNGTSFNLLQTYTASTYVTATRAVFLLPSAGQASAVNLQWIQIGNVANIWSIDDIKFYSTDNNCPQFHVAPISTSAVSTTSYITSTTVMTTSVQPTSSSTILTTTVQSTRLSSTIRITTAHPASSTVLTTTAQPTSSTVLTTTARPASSTILTTTAQPISSTVLTTTAQPASSTQRTSSTVFRTTAQSTTTTTTSTVQSSMAVTTSTTPSSSSVLITSTPIAQTTTVSSSVVTTSAVQTSEAPLTTTISMTSSMMASTSSIMEPTPSPSQMPDNCFETFDSLDNGVYSSALWSSLTGVNIEMNPCRTRADDAMLFFGLTAREAITHALNLTDVSAISFMLQSGSLRGACEANNSATITVSYREETSADWISISNYYPSDYTSEQLVLLSLPTTARSSAVQLRWYQSWYSGYRLDTWSLDDVLIGAVDTLYVNQPVTGFMDDFNSGLYNFNLWETIEGGIVRVPPCGPVVSGAALYFSNSDGTQSSLTNRLNLTNIGTISFHLGLDTCTSTSTAATIMLEYRTEGNQSYIMQTYVEGGNHIVTLPPDARTNNVQLQWSALRNGVWSMDNVRIGSDALLYNLQFDIQVGNCSSPPINGSSLDYVSLEYYDGVTWSLLQTDCRLQSRCLLTEGSVYSYNRYYKKQRVVVPLWPLVIQNKPIYQLRWGVNRQIQWSIDNIYIGKDCLNYCQGAGYCTTTGECQCDSGITAPSCPVRSSNPQTVITDFDSPTDTIPLPVVYGAELSTECGVLSSGRSLVFRYGRIREMQTEDLDTTRTLYIQFAFASGSRSCGGEVSTDNAIFLQFSLDKGITWNTLQIVGSSLQSSTGLNDQHIVIPPEARYAQTRFRLWQPNAVANDYNIWFIDNFLIGGVDMNFPAIMEDFNPINQNSWAFYPGGTVETYCSSAGNSMHFVGQPAQQNTLTTLDLYISSDTFVQFDLITSCSTNNSEAFYIQLEYSTNGGLTWSLIENNCQSDCENQSLFGSTYYQTEYANRWRRVTLPISNVNAYGTAVRLRWRQEYITSNVAGEWALDNIVIGNRSVHCPQLCNGRGRCTLGSVCVCDEGFSGNDCETVNAMFPNNIQEMFERIDSTLWPVIVGGGINNDCGILSSGFSLVLNSGARHYVTTGYLQLTESTCVQFTLQIGSATNLLRCQMVNVTQTVIFGYSLNGGSTWRALRTFQAILYNGPQQVIVALPDEARVPAVQLGWWQTTEMQTGAFAIDDVLIGPSTYDFGSIYNDTFQSGINTNLWWSTSNGVVSRSCGELSALEFSANLMEGVATTRPLAIQAAPTVPVVLHEGFDVTSDSTRLVSEGWSFTGQISSLCGFLYSNGTALTFANDDNREVITKPVDTTYASDVRFYLLFGGQQCSGINDETRGIQLSYMNDDSNNWVQIAFYSDTVLYANSVQVSVTLPIAARRPNTRLRWQQPNHSSMLLRDIWSIDEITIYRRPINYNLQFSYTTGCNTDTPSEVQVEYFSSSTNCTWRQLEHFVAPTSCDDLTTSYFQSMQLTASTWTRVTLPLPQEAFTASTQFRWSGQESCPTCQFSLDNVYIRPGCPNNCHNQGTCVNGECSCDVGYSGPACLPTSAIRELREDFSEYPLNSTLWSSVGGNNGNLNSRCGRLTGFYSMSFSGLNIRELITADIDTANANHVEFVFRLGGDATICHTPNNPSESVILQYSIDGGASWDNLAILCYSQFRTATHVSYELTPQSQTRATRFRWWQPSHSGEAMDEWAIADVFIGGNLALNTIFDSFDPINNNNWLFYSGANITEHCRSQRNALVFSRDGDLSTRDFYATVNHIIQFDLNLLTCDCGPPSQSFSHIQLEYSVDRGNSWRLLSTDAIFPPSDYQQWRSVVVSIPESVADQTLRLRWTQITTDYSCWAIDNVNICSDCGTRPLNELYDDFENPELSSLQWQTPFQYGRITARLCDRSSNILQFSTVGLPSYAITRPLNLTITAGTTAFIQFDLVINCDGNTAGTQNIELQYSTDGSNWNLVQEQCLPPNDCETYTIGSVYYSTMYTSWRRVLVVIPSSLYGSPFELRFISDSEDSFVWAADNVYIGSGCSLQCVQHGSCVNNTCRCDNGFSSPRCQPTIPVPSFKEDFEVTPQADRWPVVTGGSISSSEVASGNALVFNRAGIRYIESRDMDLSVATFLQMSLQLNMSVTADKAIYIDYSIDGGLSWITLTRIYYSNAKRNTDTDNPATQRIFSLPADAQTEATRIRLWQPGSFQQNDAIWRIDDFYVGGAREAPLNVQSDFTTTSLPSELWPSHPGGVTRASYCGRDGVILFDSSSSGLHHLATTFLDLSGGLNLIQFEINVGCGVNTGTRGAVNLEFYYLNSSMPWTPIIDRCDANGQCMNTHEETIYYSVNYGRWTRISVVIDEDTSSRVKSFRWDQGYYTSDDMSYPSWALSNVYIGLANSCPNFCSGNGMCTINGCQCDPGYAPPMCLSATARPTTLNDDFTDSNIDATKWSEVYGGSIGTICSSQNNGNSLYFNQPGIRKAVTIDLDMTTAQMLSFQVNSGVASTNCAAPQSINEGILFQYSTNGGVTWATLLNIAYNDNSAEMKTVAIPDAAKTSYTRFRWWQPFNPGLNLAQWSLDNIRINYVPIVLDGFFEDFDSDVQAISDYDGSIDSYCTSNGNGMILNGAANTSAVTEVIRFSNTILTLQFRMATSCNDNINGEGSTVILEASADDGATWQQAILPCDDEESCLNTRFFMPSVWGWENRAGWYRYTISLARLPTSVSGKLGRLRWRKLNGETLSLDEIYVGQECPNRCSLHGDCREEGCICDDGYEGGDCSVVKNKEDMITDIIDNFEGRYANEKTWLQVNGGAIRDTCPSAPLRGTSLHFNGKGIRLAITKPFDASNVEEFSFSFYYGDNCEQTTSGSQVSVALSTDLGISWDVVKILGQTTQGSITVAVAKSMRMKNAMLGWFQLQHKDGTADSWTIDDINVTLSLDTSSGGSATGDNSGNSGGSSPTWIYGVIAGVVIVVIVALIIVAIVFMKMRSRKAERYEFNAPTKPVINTEFQNPLYGGVEGTLGVSNELVFNASEENASEENDNDD